jgi:cytoskeletal protein CcmA (bactofilin family)
MLKLLISSAVLTATTFAKEATVELLSAKDYVILAKTGISTVPDSVITGDIAVSPIAAAAMTGFDFSRDSEGQFSTSAQLVGKAYAADYFPPTPTKLTTAVSAMEAAYTDAAGRLCPDAARLDLGGGTLGGAFGGAENKLTPGVYRFGTDVSIALTIYIEGSGMNVGEGDTDIFVIQIAGNLIQAANTQVILTNGALPQNIFWQVAGHVQVDAGAHLEGNVLVKTDILFKTGASLAGRVLSQTACNLQMATITQPAN